MIEHTYYRSGHWKAVCTVCGAEEIFESLKLAFETGRRHARECGT